MLGRDDRLVLISLASRRHFQRAVILILVNAAITQADSLDSGWVSRLGGDGQRLFRRGARHSLAREGWRLVVIAGRSFAGQKVGNRGVVLGGGRAETLPLLLQRVQALLQFDQLVLPVT